MDCTILKHVRQHLYECFERGADALFNLGDALLSESQAQSLPELSLSPFFERQWPSVYEALEDGRLNVERVRALWVSVLLAERGENEPVWIAVDGSKLPRPSARTSADRTIIHLSNLPLVDKPIGVGWTFSTVVLVPEQASSWTPLLDQERINSDQTAIEVAIAQLRALRPLFGSRPVIVLADRWYSTPEFLRACHELGVSRLDPAQEQSQALPGARAHQETGRSPQRWSPLSGQTPRDPWDR